MLLSGARLARQLGRLRKILGESVPIRKLGRVRLAASSEISVPFSTLGLGCAWALFPSALLGRPRDLKLAIRHELEHHRRRDTAWAIAIELMQCLFFANPALLRWKREIVELQEFSCDSRLLGRKTVSPHEYASCLVRVAEAALGKPVAPLAGTAGMATDSGNPNDVKSLLRRRIEMFASHRSQSGSRSTGFMSGTLCVFSTLAVAFAAQQTLRPSDSLHPNPGSPAFDPVVERIAEDSLRRAVHNSNARAGFVIVADPRTGRVWAAASAGSPEPGIAADSNWALSYLLEPASAVKGISAAAAIENGVTTPDEDHDCERGHYQYGGHVYRDWKTPGFDHLTTTGTVTQSSNICGIKIGEALGAAALGQMLHDFGFGPGGTASEFPSAMPGRYPEPGQIADEDYIPMLSTGYSAVTGFYVTPLEMVQAYAAIANGGKLLKPLPASAPDSEATVVGRPLSEATSLEMRSILRQAVLSGTGTNAQSRLYTTAGKTSTAYHPSAPDHARLGGEQGIAGFVGFAPVDEPRVAIYAGIIDPNGGHNNNVHGNAHAAPVFRDVAERVLLYLGVAPNR